MPALPFDISPSKIFVMQDPVNGDVDRGDLFVLIGKSKEDAIARSGELGKLEFHRDEEDDEEEHETIELSPEQAADIVLGSRNLFDVVIDHINKGASAHSSIVLHVAIGHDENNDRCIWLARGWPEDRVLLDDEQWLLVNAIEAMYEKV